MKKILSFCSLFCLFICCQSPAQDAMDAATFEKKLTETHPQLLDVRTASEYQSGHLSTALQADWLNKQQFADRVQYLDKSKPVLVYCASGVRSAAAAKWLKENGFASVSNLKGGLTAWKLEGRPIEAPAAQAQLTIAQYKAQTVSDKLVLVDFGAAWCPPCKQMEPVLEKLAKDLPGAFKLVKVDGGNDIDVMKSQKVEALPVFIIYKNGKETWRKQGVIELDVLKKALQN